MTKTFHFTESTTNDKTQKTVEVNAESYEQALKVYFEFSVHGDCSAIVHEDHQKTYVFPFGTCAIHRETEQRAFVEWTSLTGAY
jgi:hypothetical protein